MDLSVLAAESGMSAGDAVSVSSTGMIVVLIVLIVLAVLVLLISKGVRAAQGKSKQTEEATAAATTPVTGAQSAAPAASAAAPVVNGVPLPENQSAGQLELYDCDEKSAAVIMAIISNESGITLNHLEFKSIKAIEE